MTLYQTTKSSYSLNEQMNGDCLVYGDQANDNNLDINIKQNSANKRIKYNKITILRELPTIPKHLP